MACRLTLSHLLPLQDEAAPSAQRAVLSRSCTQASTRHVVRLLILCSWRFIPLLVCLAAGASHSSLACQTVLVMLCPQHRPAGRSCPFAQHVVCAARKQRRCCVTIQHRSLRSRACSEWVEWELEMWEGEEDKSEFGRDSIGGTTLALVNETLEA